MERILYVDSSLEGSEVIQNQLSKNQYKIDWVYNSFDAKNHSDLNEYSACVINCQLKDESGLNFASYFRESNKEACLILISDQHLGDHFVEECLRKFKASRFLIKPFLATHLLSSLNELLRGERSRLKLFEVIATSPSLCFSEIKHHFYESPYIVGFELPLLLTQLSILKQNTNLDIYNADSLVAQIRFQNSRIVQIFSFMENVNQSSNHKLESLNSLIGSHLLRLQFYNSNSQISNVNVENYEILSWSENLTFKKIPTYWISNQILSLLGSRMFERSFQGPRNGASSWPVHNERELQRTHWLHRTPLQLFNVVFYKEDLLRSLYNLTLNGSCWFDDSKKILTAEMLEPFLSWHYQLISKINYFELLEIDANQDPLNSINLQIFHQLWLNIENLNDPKCIDWLALQRTLLHSSIERLKLPEQRQVYKKNLDLHRLNLMSLRDQASKKLLESFEQINLEAMKSITEGLKKTIPLEDQFLLIDIWYKLNSADSLLNLDSNEIQITLKRLNLPSEFEYIKNIVRGRLYLLEGERPLARRSFVEAQKLNPDSIVAFEELKSLDKKKARSIWDWIKNIEPLSKNA